MKIGSVIVRTYFANATVPDFALTGTSLFAARVFCLCSDHAVKTRNPADVYQSQFSSKHSRRRLDLRHFLRMDICPFSQSLDFPTYTRKVIFGALFKVWHDSANEGHIFAIGLHSLYATQARFIALNYLLNGLAKYYVNSSVNIQSARHQFPSDKDTKPLIEQRRSTKAGLVWIMYGLQNSFSFIEVASFGIAFFGASFVFIPIKERVVGAKHLQVCEMNRLCVFPSSSFVYIYFMNICHSSASSRDEH